MRFSNIREQQYFQLIGESIQLSHGVGVYLNSSSMSTYCVLKTLEAGTSQKLPSNLLGAAYVYLVYIEYDE